MPPFLHERRCFRQILLVEMQTSDEVKVFTKRHTDGSRDDLLNGREGEDIVRQSEEGYSRGELVVGSRRVYVKDGPLP